MELKIDSERVLNLAKKCPQWNDALKELFPEVFVNNRMELEDWSVAYAQDNYDSIKVLYKGRPVIWIGRRYPNDKLVLNRFTEPGQEFRLDEDIKVYSI